MTFQTSLHNESSILIQQLAGLSYIVDTNSDLLNKNPISKEFLGFKIDLVESYIAELHILERLGDQSKCKSTFDDAQIILEQIQAIVDGMLDERCEEAWLDFQRELRFTNNMSVPHEYVLKEKSKHLSIAV